MEDKFDAEIVEESVARSHLQREGNIAGYATGTAAESK